MIDDERREVARKLRHEADYWASSGPTDTCLDYTASTVYSVLECIGMGDGCVPIHSMLNRLAELIDRPICHPETVPFGPCGDMATGCSVCGKPLSVNPYGGKGNRYYRRCCHCGAEVVSDE